MTRTEEALLSAVIADPNDDLPRLAFADFCEEQGDDARAEFIRCQLELARVGEVALPDGTAGMRTGCAEDDRRERALRRRERELLHDPVHWWAWLAELYALTGRSAIGDMDHCSDDPDTFAVRFRRGFVAEILLPCASWMRHGPALVRAAPLERVTLAGKEPVCPVWESGPDERWWWVAAAPANAYRPEALPRVLFRATARQDDWHGRTSSGLGFASRDEALTGLSLAALSWARAAAVAAPPAAGV